MGEKQRTTKLLRKAALVYSQAKEINNNNEKEKETKRSCRDPGLFRARASSPDLNQGPSDLQSDALPTELSRQLM